MSAKFATATPNSPVRGIWSPGEPCWCIGTCCILLATNVSCGWQSCGIDKCFVTATGPIPTQIGKYCLSDSDSTPTPV